MFTYWTEKTSGLPSPERLTQISLLTPLEATMAQLVGQSSIIQGWWFEDIVNQDQAEVKYLVISIKNVVVYHSKDVRTCLLLLHLNLYD